MNKKEVPITIDFDKTKQIGVAFIDSDALPPGANYRFEPTFEILEMKPTEDGNIIVRAELIELSLTPKLPQHEDLDTAVEADEDDWETFLPGINPFKRLFSWIWEKHDPIIKGGHKVISPNPPESRGFKGRKWGTKVP